MQDHGCGHLQLLERIRRGLQVAPRQVEIDRRMREIGVPEQYLNRPEVGARFQEMRGVAVSQRILTLLMNLLPPSFTTVTIPSTANP